MKRIYSILLTGLAFMAVLSCEKAEEQPEGSALKVKESSLTIPARGGEATIEFVSGQAIGVTVDKEWCSVTVDGLKAVITAGANESYESRYAGVKVTAGTETLDFTVQQFGYYSSGFAPSDIKTSSKAAEFDFPYEYNEEIAASSEAEWITITVTEDNLHVALAENTVEGTPENSCRTAEISWTLGHDSGVINVTQNNRSFMNVDDNWNVYYDGVHDFQGEQAAFIANDVTDPAISGKYGIYYMTKAEFTASGMEMDDFAIVVAEQFRDEINALIDLLGAYGYELTFGDCLYEDSDYEVFDLLEDGDYIAFALGFTEEAEMTGHYAYSDFTVKTGGGGATGYEAWLGEWEVQRGAETDTWKISADVAGSTYVITGIEGMDFPVAASYVAGSDMIEVRAQDGIGTISTTDYGDCTVGLFGGWGESSFATGTYVIFTGKASGNKASLTPGKVSFSDGSSYTLERVQFIATTADSRYLRVSRDLTPLPTTMTKKGGSGGGEGGEGSEAYNKWLGTWSVDSFEMNLRQKTADKLYFMRGWQFAEDFFEDVEATFESDGSVILYGNSEVPVARNVDIDAPEGNCDLYYVGKVLMSGKEYYITSDGAYDVATGRIQADGSAVFSGNEVELSDGGTYQFVRMELIAVPISDPDGGVYTFNNKPSEFPLTASKAGRSSVKAAAVWNKAGAWTRSSTGMIAAAPEREAFEECTPYMAVPEVPVRFRRHIEY